MSKYNMCCLNYDLIYLGKKLFEPTRPYTYIHIYICPLRIPP